MSRATRRLVPALVLAAALLAGSAAWADSPLTSTDFSGAYSDVPLVVEAGRQGLSPAVIVALRDPQVPHDVRVAIVNAVGWRCCRPRGLGRVLLDGFAAARGVPPSRLRMSDLTAEEAVSLGYMQALDDYLDLRPIGGRGEVERASPTALMDLAARLAPSDFAVALMRGLVRAQVALHDDRWCDCHREVFSVVDGFGGPRNLRPAAVSAITSYMSAYADSCRR